MDKITSFTIDHVFLQEGLYVSRIDQFGSETITTFDIRMKRPNLGEYLSTTSAHTIEHLGATFLRNHPLYSSKTVYFGPMGCRTGFYAIFHGRYTPMDIADLMKEMFAFIADYEGAIPGCSLQECGNYLDLELSCAKADALFYLEHTLNKLSQFNTEYPAT